MITWINLHGIVLSERNSNDYILHNVISISFLNDIIVKNEEEINDWQRLENGVLVETVGCDYKRSTPGILGVMKCAA